MDPLAEVHHGYNPYNYVLNNPMLYMDPLGLDTLGINSSEPIQKGDAVRLEDGSVVTNLMADAQVTAPSKPSGTLLSSFYTGGEQVMDPVNGFWNQVLYTTSPRTYNGYEVDNSGRIKPRYIGGTVDVGLASRFKLFGVAAKGAAKFLNQFNSVESLIKAAQPTFGKALKHGELQGFIKGNADAIFKSITNGGTVLQSGAVQMSNGNTIRMYNATSTGASTIFINTPSQIFKIRITP